VAFQQISIWLASCLEKHPECRVKDLDFLPRRVIDVGACDNGNGLLSDKVRLIETAKEHINPTLYAALSYCWGSDIRGVTITEKHSLESHFSGILLESLPQSIYDAVVVCRNLKIPYLWVDSLCIVQDDTRDWETESAQMHQIYANSHITIAAHKAASAKAGFLGEQTYGQPTYQAEFRAITKGVGSDSMPARLLVRGKYFEEDSRRPTSPLERRGWTLQECILPKRVLHFTNEELIWECCTRHFCECGHIHGESELYDTMVKTDMYKDESVRRSQLLSGDAWMRLIEIYSARKITEISDKLVAISALAQLAGNTAANTSSLNATFPETVEAEPAESLTPSFYLAGLLRSELHRQLLWYTGDLKPMPRMHTYATTALPDSSWGIRPALYRAPTWSWASVNTPITYSLARQQLDSMITVSERDSFCEPAVPENVTGAVIYGQLGLEGLLVPVKLRTFSAMYGDLSGLWPNWSSNPSPNWSDNRLPVTVIRGPNCQPEAVYCDLLRDKEAEHYNSKFHHCWRTDGDCVLWRENKAECPGCRFEPAQWSDARFSCLKVAQSKDMIYFLVLELVDREKKEWERMGMGFCRNESNLFKGANKFKIRIV
jgi:hypothetical protein